MVPQMSTMALQEPKTGEKLDHRPPPPPAETQTLDLLYANASDAYIHTTGLRGTQGGGVKMATGGGWRDTM